LISAMNGTITIRESYRELTDIAAARIADIRSRKPLVPVYLLVRSNLVAVQLKRFLADELGGILNIRFLTFPDLLEKIESERDEMSEKLSPVSARLIIEKMKYQGSVPRYFSGISESSGFSDSILRTITDLSEAGLDLEEAERLAGSGACRGLSERVRSVISTFTDYRKEVEKQGADIHTRFMKAAEGGVALDGPLLVYGFYDFNQLQINLLASVASGQRVELLMVSARDNSFPEASMERLEKAGFSITGEGKEERMNPAGLRGILVEAYDEEGEAAEIARMILETVKDEGVLFRDIGIVYPSDDCFPPVEEALEEAGVPYYVSRAEGPESSRAVRSLTLLLDLIGGRFGRKELVEFLLLAPLAVPGERSAEFDPFDLWVGATAAEGISGQDDWLKKNSSFLNDLRLREDNEDTRRVIEAAEIVGGILAEIEKSRIAVEGKLTWEEISSTVSSLASRILRDETVLEGIFDTGLDRGSTTLTYEAFSGILKKLIRRGSFRRGSFLASGVNLLTLQQLRGLSFRILFLGGLIHEKLPGRIQQDPFIRDREREELNRISEGKLFLQEKMSRYEEIELIFTLALRSASEKLVCSLALFEGDDDRKRLRSYLVDMLEDFTSGGNLRLEKKLITADRRPSCYISADEYLFFQTSDFHRKGQGPLPARSFFDRSVKALMARMNTASFFPWDGVFSSPEALGAVRDEMRERRFSATFLQSYSNCPFVFFMKYILGAEPIEDPELTISIDAMQRGQLMHGILEKAYIRFRDRGLLPLRKDKQEEISGILKSAAEMEFEIFSGRQAVGLDFMWKLSREEITESVELFLKREAESEEFYIPVGLEEFFGAGEQPVEISLSVSGRRIRIRGKIDRLDTVGGDDSFRVIDYKSRKPSGARNNDFSCGKHIQLPLYLLGASAILDKPLKEGIAEYREVSTEPSGAVVFEGSELEKKREEFDRIIETTISSIENGLFFYDPTGSWCRFCNYKPACPASRKRLFRGKAGNDSRCLEYRRMKEMED